MMRRAAVLFVFVSLLSACAPADPELAVAPEPTDLFEEVEVPPLEDEGPAPEIEGEIWLNSDVPLRLEDLRGEVVLLEMWTFGCINCQRVIPHLRGWHEEYADEGLVVIGNHYPEFPYEEDLGNLRDAVNRFEIAYPVVQDNAGRNWRAYSNRYWPTTYLIDKRGHLRYQHIGEGAYKKTEAAIQTLLAE